MTTYIIESQGCYKVGKTTNFSRTVSEFNTHNPKYEIVHTIDFDCEKFLHMKFEGKAIRFSWYSLLDTDVQWIKENHHILVEHTLEKMELMRKEEIAKMKADKKEQRRQSKIRRKHNEIKKRELQDKEQEEWLLRMLEEHPEHFSI